MSGQRVLGILLISLGGLVMVTGSFVAASGAEVTTGVGTDPEATATWNTGWTAALFGLAVFFSGTALNARARGFR